MAGDACVPLAAPETPELEAALRAADHDRLPLKVRTAFDNLCAKPDGLANRIDGTGDNLCAKFAEASNRLDRKIKQTN